jgi:hypothetical protein
LLALIQKLSLLCSTKNNITSKENKNFIENKSTEEENKEEGKKKRREVENNGDSEKTQEWRRREVGESGLGDGVLKSEETNTEENELGLPGYYIYI